MKGVNQMSEHKKEETKLDVQPDEKHLLLDHNYDGIQELNHPLPSWWSVIFWGAIFYSSLYFIYYQFMSGPTLREEFNKDFAVIEAAQLEFKKANQKFRPDAYVKVANSDGVLKGKEIYEMNCMPCHSDNGRGDVGPNLTDKYWLVAKGTPETIHNVVFNGVEANGMPAWGEVLEADDIYLAVAYVSSIKNSYQRDKQFCLAIRNDETNR